METFAQKISTSDWWLSVIMVGLFINLLTEGIKYFGPVLLGRVSRWWQMRNDAISIIRLEKIDSLVKSDEEYFYYQHSQAEIRFDILLNYISALLIFGFGYLGVSEEGVLRSIIMVIALIPLLMGVSSIVKHGQRSLLLQEAHFLRSRSESTLE